MRRELDTLYLARACELAARGVGNVSPNPPVGAVIVAGGRIIGEGFHHARGEAHAEVEALHDAAARGHEAAVAGATMYVSLEPCNHHGRTPPCSEAVVAAHIERVVIGAMDPNPRTAGGGIARLHAAGIAVDVHGSDAARELIRRFRVSVTRARPYVTLKLAASIDGYIAPEPGAHWLTGEASRTFVHALRGEHDAVAVGAGTLRIDDPRLVPRPPLARRRVQWRIAVCGATPPSVDRRLFAQVDGVRTLLIVPAAHASAFASLADVARIVAAETVDGRVALPAALQMLHELEIASLLCEGGPRLAADLLAHDLVDRIEWLTAPVLLANPRAVPALAGNVRPVQYGFESVGTWSLGSDVRVAYDRASGRRAPRSGENGSP